MQPNRTGIYASQISGHLWAPEGAYDALATVTLGSSTTYVDFIGIPQGYKHLQIRDISRNTRVANTGACFHFAILNSDSGSNYSYHFLEAQGDNTNLGAGSGTNSSYGCLVGQSPGTQYTTNTFATNITDILDYSDPNKFKTTRTLSGSENNFESSIRGAVYVMSGGWRNSAPVTSIRLQALGVGNSNFIAGSTFALYGVK
jgi:hypothetical protein